MTGLDLRIRGGIIVTMDAERSVVEGDLLVRGRDILSVTGTPGKVERRPARVLDARGCAVLPGLVQAHVHLCQTLFRGLADGMALLPWLRERIWPLEAAHDAASLHASAELGLAEMLLAGTTTILDMGTVHEQDAVFEAMLASGIRGMSGKAMMDRGPGRPPRLRERTRESLDESERLCARWNGAADGRLGYAFAPRFVLSCTERLLRGVAERANENRALMHTHVAESQTERAAVREALGTEDVAALARTGIRGPRAVLAHGVHLRAGEMRSISRAGTRVVHCPSANLKLASGIAKVAAMRRAGVTVGLGADGAACNDRLDPWTEMRLASLLARTRERTPTCFSPLDALEMATIEGARVLGLDAEIGSLEAGKRADLVVVRLDGLHVEPDVASVVDRLVHAATSNDVRHVIVDGRVLVEDRQLQTLDIDDVRERARREIRQLLARTERGRRRPARSIDHARTSTVR